MEIQLINDDLLSELHEKAMGNERLRQHFDLRTTPEDTSQRILNMLEPGTQVPIHRHEDTSETVVCIKGCLDWIIYEEVPSVDAMGAEREYKEIFRTEICPAKGKYGIQVPMGVWHTIEVKEVSCIFEAMDGGYK